MGVLQSIPLCARGNSDQNVDKNNNALPIEVPSAEVKTSQPQSSTITPPVSTSTPTRPLSPTGIVNDQYNSDNSLASSSSDDGDAEARAGGSGDSGLEDSATDFEFSRPTSNDVMNGVIDMTRDEGVPDEEEVYDDTLPYEVPDPEVDESDEGEEIDLGDDPVERPPEPTVPDELVESPEREILAASTRPPPIVGKEDTTRKISNILSELVGDHPIPSQEVDVAR